MLQTQACLVDQTPVQMMVLLRHRQRDCSKLQLLEAVVDRKDLAAELSRPPDQTETLRFAQVADRRVTDWPATADRTATGLN